MRRTYITVEGEVKNYEYDKTLHPRKKRPRCEVCGQNLWRIYCNPMSEYKRMGYYCKECKVMYMDVSMGKVFRCVIEEGGVK